MRKKKNIFWFIICFALTIICFSKIHGLFTIGEIISYKAFNGLYNEKPDSMDALFIGSSNVHAFWQPPLAWADHGIAVRSWSLNSLKLQSVIYMIEEARKTQPDTLFIINLNCFKNTDVTYVFMHRIADYMKFSINKIKTISALAEEAGYKWTEVLEFYFPIIRFHSKWANFTSFDYIRVPDYYKGGLATNNFLSRVHNLSEVFTNVNSEKELDPDQERILLEILDYCEEKQVRVLFTAVPQVLGGSASKSVTTSLNKQLNKAASIVQERGFDFINIWGSIDEAGIQVETDFYDEHHTNIHGSNKFTEYLAQYLIDHYGFIDKRGAEGWENWDKAAEAYLDLTGFYLIPIERSHELRDYSLPVPGNQTAVVEGQTITLTWNASEGAQSYDIYRRSTDYNEKNWAYIASVDMKEEGNIIEYIDSDLQSDVKYTYIIVPKYEADGKTYYGNFSYSGISAKTGF